MLLVQHRLDRRGFRVLCVFGGSSWDAHGAGDGGCWLLAVMGFAFVRDFWMGGGGCLFCRLRAFRGVGE